MVKWRKLGLVYRPAGNLWWAREYAHLPTAMVLDDRIRVYYATLDNKRYGRICYVDLDREDPTKVISAPSQPILVPGNPGHFDACGVNPSCIIPRGSYLFMYYIGWQKCETVPYLLFSGVAVATYPEMTFCKTANVPLLDRNNEEPVLRSAPCVIKDGDVFKMWYVSGSDWTMGRGEHHYNNAIRYLESPRPFVWEGTGRLCLAPQGPRDYSEGRPWVIKENGIYKMWTSTRSGRRKYRISYAESPDGEHWTRKPSGIETSPPGAWDSEMIAYACVVDVGDKRFMFYNGNSCGQSGFGVAVEER